MKNYVIKIFSLLSVIKYSTIGLILSCTISLEATAASFTVSDNLVIRDVNDKTINHGLLSKKQTIDLKSGEHSIVLKYKDVFEDLDLGIDTVVSSEYFVVQFTVSHEKSLVLSTVAINDLSAAEKFSSSPELTLMDEHKKSLVLTLKTLSDYNLAKEVNKVVTTLSTATPEVINASNNTSAKQENVEARVSEQVDNLPMLKYWWNKANAKEKNLFLNYVEQTKAIKDNR